MPNPRTSTSSEPTAPDAAAEQPSAPAAGTADISTLIDNDPADTTTKIPTENLDGPRIRAIPYDNGSTIVVRKADFADHGIDHKTITFDFRNGDLTLPVVDKKGENYENTPVVERAIADWLTSKYPMQFEYLNGNRGEASE